MQALAPGEWHTVEVELRMNDVGRANGVIRLEVDGTRVISTDDVVFRTAAYPDMRFNQLVIGPYMGRSPIEQSFQLDDLVVMEGLP